MIYLFVFNYFCFRVHYLLTSAVMSVPDSWPPCKGGGHMHTLRMRCGGGLAVQLRRPLAVQSSCAAGKSLQQKSGDFCHLPFQGRRGCARLFTESDNSRAANQVRGVSSFPGHEAVASFQNHMTYIRILNTQINIRKPPARGAGPARSGQLCPGNQERGRDRGGTNVLV